MMIDYSLAYVAFYSFMMSISSGIALTYSGMKLRYKPWVCFLMLFIPKAFYNFCRFYMESYGISLIPIIVLTFFCIFFDFALIVAVFDCSFQEKVLTIIEMDLIFIPVLIVKQKFETKFQREANGPLYFENGKQFFVLVAAYVAAFAVVLVVLYFVSHLLRKINYDTKLFNIFGKIALGAYLFIEVASIGSYVTGIMVRTFNIIAYLLVALLWGAVFAVLYMINSYFTKKKLLREIEVLNSEKEREHKYYNLIKNHNDEIRRIRHDLNGHFAAINSLVKNGEYDRLEDYVSGLSESFFEIKRVTYSSNLMADAVISSIAQKCKDDGINFEFAGTLPDDCGVDDISLTCIFSNILNNAFEACQRIDKSDAFIRLNVHCRNDCIVIDCKNSKSIDEKPEKGQFLTLKEESGHGYGMKIIKDIVASYDGAVTFEDGGDTFDISLLLSQNSPVQI